MLLLHIYIKAYIHYSRIGIFEKTEITNTKIFNITPS